MSLLAMLPQALSVFSSVKAFKDNLKTKSTAASVPVATATAYMATQPQDMETILMELAGAVVTLILFLYNKNTATK